VRFAKVGGMIPLIPLLKERSKYSRLVREPTLGGIGPDSWLLFKSNILSFEQFVSASGRLPSSELPLR